MQLLDVRIGAKGTNGLVFIDYLAFLLIKEQKLNHLAETWLAKIKRKDIAKEQYHNIRVCSEHFIRGSPSQLYDQNNPDWAPCLKLGYEQETTTCIKRYERAERRRRLCLKESTDIVITDELGDDNEVVSENEEVSENDLRNKETSAVNECHNVATQTEESYSKEQDIEDLKQAVSLLRSELAEQIIDEEYFKYDDKKVLYYTGLSTWSLLMKLFVYVKRYLTSHSIMSLSTFQQLVMTLIRLRLNLPSQDLGYRFKVHNSTVSRIFTRVISMLFVKLKPLIKWPERDASMKTMPMVFRKHFPRCVVIIDCFEIFLDRPTNLLARAQTYSSYKHHNTVKYLIGVTPQGTVSFISEGWGGRTSDKFLTEHSYLLDHLVPGDTVLADRGFDIKDSVGMKLSRLELPAFTKHKAQLNPIDVEQTRNVANVRIHIERVIGNIRKKYSILSATQPIDFVISNGNETPTLDKIVYVCSALINICESVVPFD